ncbi:hypothetical protein [Chishuiella changwenlii]|uniref:hypothetical protein n=1 Tax=Chishuiella changwenlii TaxID=1434701 RepID=UPI002FDA1A9E
MDIDSLLLMLLFILAFIGIPVGIGLLLYFIPKKLGYPKIAKYLIILYGIFVLTMVFYTMFSDELFSKNSAKELVEEQNIKLKDDFELLTNKSMSAIGDYYHTFTLSISSQDKQEAITRIKNSDNFTSNTDSIDTFMYQKVQNRYFGKKIIQNYETESSFVREYFEPSGREGYAPTFRRISISKINNELQFEDID